MAHIVGGSTVAQFLYQSYHDGAVQPTAELVNNVLTAVTPWVQSAMAIVVLIIGKQLIGGSLSRDRLLTICVRVFVVLMLLTPGNFAKYITTGATETIPNAITNAAGGTMNLTGAQGFDALINAVDNFGAQAREQASPATFYIGERVTIWLAEMAAWIPVVGCMFVWLLAASAILFMLPLLALVLPFYIFDSTREFAMRAAGKIFSLFLVMFVAVALSAFVVKTDAQYIQQYGKLVAANAANSGFKMNAGDFNFTGSEELGVGGALGGTPPAAASANVDAAISTLWKVALVFAVGIFLMTIMVGLALYVGMSSGFNAGPALTLITMVAMRGASAGLSAARPARARVRA